MRRRRVGEGAAGAALKLAKFPFADAGTAACVGAAPKFAKPTFPVGGVTAAEGNALKPSLAGTAACTGAAPKASKTAAGATGTESFSISKSPPFLGATVLKDPRIGTHCRLPVVLNRMWKKKFWMRKILFVALMTGVHTLLVNLGDFCQP